MTRLVYSRSSRPGESVCGRPYWWFHYLVIEDGGTTLIYMKEALFGMNFGEVEFLPEEGWTAEQIVAWKRESGDDRLREVPEDEAARVLAWLDSRP